jgi:outer membrane protein assembly factor BamB
MFGTTLPTFNYPCSTDIAPDTVKDLQLAWFFNTADVVTATPAVIDGNAYVGDWSGRFCAIDTSTGEKRWTFQAATEPNVRGNIVSAAVTAVDDKQAVIYDGRTLSLTRHRRNCGTTQSGPPVDDFSEISRPRWWQTARCS